MKKQFIHKPVVFNLNNPQHRKIYEWIQSETTNFSNFIFQSLVMRYEQNQSPKPVKMTAIDVEDDIIDSWLGEG